LRYCPGLLRDYGFKAPYNRDAAKEICLSTDLATQWTVPTKQSGLRIAKIIGWDTKRNRARSWLVRQL
jgi:hypothetical protein